MNQHDGSLLTIPLALHFAASNGHLNIVMFFISELNCDPANTPGERDRQALHFAVKNGHLPIVKYLIEDQHCDSTCQDTSKSLHFTFLL